MTRVCGPSAPIYKDGRAPLALWLLFMAVAVLVCRTALGDETDCGLPRCSVQYEHGEDAEIGCEGIKRAIEFFRSFGFHGKDAIFVTFEDRVVVPRLKTVPKALHGKQIAALYDSRDRQIRVTSFRSAYFKNVKIFSSISVNKELLTSVVAHEVAHRLHHMISAAEGVPTYSSLSAFVAYVTQIATMADPARSEVLALWPGESLPSVDAINADVYQLAPNKFGVMSYRFHKEHPSVLKAILDGTIRSREAEFSFDYCDF